jgi:hypothetical protein
VIKIEFTKEELKEIEKLFDFVAGQTTINFTKVMETLDKVKDSKKAKEEFFEDFLKAYEVSRQISAKASKMQEEIDPNHDEYCEGNMCYCKQRRENNEKPDVCQA